MCCLQTVCSADRARFMCARCLGQTRAGCTGTQQEARRQHCSVHCSQNWQTMPPGSGLILPTYSSGDTVQHSPAAGKQTGAPAKRRVQLMFGFKL